MRFFSHTKWLRRSLRDLIVVLSLYTLISYGILPPLLRHYEHNPSLENAPKTTESSAGLPGDALNIALVGSQEELIRSMLIAGWLPADTITVKTSLLTAASIILRRNYATAPMSNLYLWGRRQDLAFEKLEKTPVRRHHVRLWLSPLKEKDGRPLWIGAASYDQGIGFNHFTGQLTHHIAADIDAERDTLISDLSRRHELMKIYQVTGVGANLAARNAGGDWYYTDGELTVGILSQENTPSSTPPIVLENPPPIDWKNKGWVYLRTILSPPSFSPRP